MTTNQPGDRASLRTQCSSTDSTGQGQKNSGHPKTPEQKSWDGYQGLAGFPSVPLTDLLARFGSAETPPALGPQNAPRIDAGAQSDANPSQASEDAAERQAGPQERTGSSERPEASENGPAPVAGPSSLDLIQESKCGKSQKTPMRPEKVTSPQTLPKYAEKLPPLAQVLERATYAKNYSRDVVEELHRRGIARPAERLHECATWIEIREYFDSGNARLRNANFCNQGRLCPGCAGAKARKQVRQIVEKSTKVYSQNPKALPFMFTLTVKNGEDLGPRMQHLLNCLNRVRYGARDYRRGKGTLREFSKIDSAIWNVEIKRGKDSGLWHPHVHGLVFSEQFFDLDKLQQEWNGITGGKHRPHVDLTRFGKLAYRQKLTPEDLAQDDTLQQTFVGDVMEISKYAVKFEHTLTPSDAVDAYLATFRKKLMRTWGGLVGVTLDPSPEDHTTEDGEYVDHLLKWFGNSYSTVRQVRGESEASVEAVRDLLGGRDLLTPAAREDLRNTYHKAGMAAG